jgi:hypothetical protein
MTIGAVGTAIVNNVSIQNSTFSGNHLFISY